MVRVWKKKGELRGRAGEDSCPPGLPVACGVKEIDFGDSCVHLSQSFKLFDAISSFKTVQTPGSEGLITEASLSQLASERTNCDQKYIQRLPRCT